MRKICYKIKDFAYQIFGTKKAFYYNPKNYYIEKFVNKYRNGKFYFNLIDKVEKMDEIKTNVAIEFIENKKLNEVVIKDVIKEYGSSNCKIISEDLLGVEILFYKLKLGKYKMKLEFHFFNDKLFFYSYVFSMNNVKDKNEIIKIIKDKYSVKGLSDKGSNYIIDDNKNIILTNNDINFSIYYLCNPKMIKENFVERIDEKEVDKYKELLFSKL